MEGFKSITLEEWQQFKRIRIDFHDKVTILTGANATGKTTILNLLATHYGWQHQPLATPRRSAKTGIIGFLTRLFNGQDRSEDPTIGSIEYTNKTEARFQINDSKTASYSINMKGKQKVDCFYIPSHRAVYRYQKVENIPVAKKNKEDAFTELSNCIKSRYFSDHGQPASFVMKNIIIGWAIKGYGVRGPTASVMPGDTELVEYYEGFQEILRKVLPPSFGFERMEIRDMEVVFVCNGGNDEFLLETASGGICAIVDLAWQIFMYSRKDRTEFTVIIDEVENHLHPTMQRRVLADFINAFPSVKFIVSTHSPLVVSSIKESSVFALIYDDDGKIISRQLDFKNKPKTAAEILDEALGVSFTMPVWVEEELKRVVGKYSKREYDAGDMKNMKRELDILGLGRLMPDAISDVLGGGQND